MTKIFINNKSLIFHFIFKIAEKGYEPYRFVIHGILLAIVVIFGLVSNLISIFIFTRPEMRSPLNLILTGRFADVSNNKAKRL